MKIILASLFVLTLISLIQYADATIDLQNKILVSDDDNFIIEFAENTVRTTLFKTTITPNLEFGIIQSIDQSILLDGASGDVSVRVLGDSIAIKSFDVPVIIYARNTGNNNYSIAVYTFDGIFKKQTFAATLESTTVIETEQVEETKQDVVIAVSNPFTTPAGKVYTLTVRIYDPVINPTADIQKQEGYLEGISIKIEILDPEGNIFETVTGETDNKGYFTFEHKVIQNIDRFGEYTFTITAGNQISEGSTFFQEEGDDGATSNP